MITLGLVVLSRVGLQAQESSSSALNKIKLVKLRKFVGAFEGKFSPTGDIAALSEEYRIRIVKIPSQRRRGSILQNCDFLVEFRGYGEEAAYRGGRRLVSRDHAGQRPAGYISFEKRPSEIPRSVGKRKDPFRILPLCLLPDDEPRSPADRTADGNRGKDNAACADRVQPTRKSGVNPAILRYSSVSIVSSQVKWPILRHLV